MGLPVHGRAWARTDREVRVMELWKGMGWGLKRGDLGQGSVRRNARALARVWGRGGPLPGGLCRPFQQAQEQVSSSGKGSKLGHVAYAPGQGNGGGPRPQQVRKTGRSLPARIVGVEG